jgi:hypothetical protein
LGQHEGSLESSSARLLGERCGNNTLGEGGNFFCVDAALIEAAKSYGMIIDP